MTSAIAALVPPRLIREDSNGGQYQWCGLFLPSPLQSFPRSTGMAFATVNMDTTSSGFKLPQDCAICPKLCSPVSMQVRQSVIYMDDVLLLESGEQGSAFCEDKCWFQWAEADKLGIVE
ncbi:hypothetical protein HanXRQr2_Chr04g0190441 [Helianthus annuus]|uniref:Uncharacterized protein n=1 Tax=Helianthus annuus TaxID=4232 RepID=A0A9K3JC78_HELAN|nr:hypothetical protein HanXRQr2_Chr04g0190441 [Helianthus annuus]KAJ0598812.1 hypothetical protein HanHA89_Chr04g0169801 [Helianthus annuus]